MKSKVDNALNTKKQKPIVKQEEESRTLPDNKYKAETMDRIHFTNNADGWAFSRWEGKGSEKYKQAYEKALKVHIKAFFGKELTSEQILKSIKESEKAKKYDDADKARINLRKANQYAIVDALDVENNSMYRKRGSDTYCNIYGYDFVTALGGYIPRVWWYSDALTKVKSGEKVTPVYAKTVREMNANDLAVWMAEYGTKHFNWRKAKDMKEAQSEANSGKLVIILADIKPIGHINVILPETEQLKANPNGGVNGKTYLPLQSQAGGVNFKHKAYYPWWEDDKNKEGGAWIFDGKPNSPIATPEQLGW